MSKKTDKKIDIIRAAIDEFTELGLSGARVDSIAKRANVSSRTLYKHYPTKDLLFADIVDLGTKKLLDVPDAEYDPDAPLFDKLTSVLDQHIEAVTNPGVMSFMRILHREFLRDRTLASQILPKANMQSKHVLNLVKEAIRTGDLVETDAEKATNQLLAMAYTALFWPVLLLGYPDPRYASRKEAIDDCVKTFLARYEI